MNRNVKSHPGFELGLLNPFLTTVTTIPCMPPYFIIQYNPNISGLGIFCQIIIIISAIGTGTGGFGNKRMSGDHPNYSIVEIGQNTKSLGNLRRLAVTQTQVENPHLMLVWKTLKGWAFTVYLLKAEWTCLKQKCQEVSIFCLIFLEISVSLETGFLKIQ